MTRRCVHGGATSLALRRFLGYGLTDPAADHSTISRNRRLVDVETHQEVFHWLLRVLARRKLLDGETVGIDATTLEANAAVRRLAARCVDLRAALRAPWIDAWHLRAPTHAALRRSGLLVRLAA